MAGDIPRRIRRTRRWLLMLGVVIGLLAQTSRTSLATLEQLDGHRRLAPDEAEP